MKVRKINRYLAMSIPMLMLLSVLACKRYYDTPAYFENNPDTVKKSSRKILIVGIDGAVGSEYKAIDAPVLSGMKLHSKYSWNAFSDDGSSTDAASWKTLMTGVSYSKHLIRDSSFVYTRDAGGNDHDVIPNYPSFFSYILSSTRADLKASFITSWPIMLTRLVPEVGDPVLAANDAAVKDSAIARIKNAKSDFIVVDFNSVAIAGKASSFSANDQVYKDAVLRVDGYVGELMAALKSRPEYNKSEEWLVIVTGTHGGVGNSYGGISDKEVSVPTFYYNENFKENEYVREGAPTGVLLKGRDASVIRAQVIDDKGLYNPGTGSQTIQIKIKGPGPGAYPHFFSKCTRFVGSGWTMFTSGANWAISIKSLTSGEKRIQNATGNVFDNQWHTLTVVIFDSAGGRWVKRFTDGTRGSDLTNLGSSFGDISSPSPLTVGWQADPGMGAVTFYSADIRIFNTALSDDEVRENLCLKDIAQHPKYANLTGYWPGNDGYGNRLKNKASNNDDKDLDFLLQGAFKWDPLTEFPCTIATMPPESKVQSMFVKLTDISQISFYWLKIPVKTAWGFEGTNWLEQYEIEFIKL